MTINAPQWSAFLKKLEKNIRRDLGIEGSISLHLYKLLLYGKGGHFRAHRDTEKLGAMIGSLIVALPSAHEGGDLWIRHDGREVRIAFSDEAHRHEYQYAAFFADCEHEVQPVRSGYRCCLTFNICFDQDFYSYSSYDDDDDDDPEDGAMGEVDEETLTISGWRDIQDRSADLGSYAILKENLLARESIDAADPDEKEAEGYTGNAGCTMDYWYHRAAIVLWAKADDEHIRCRYNLSGAA